MTNTDAPPAARGAADAARIWTLDGLRAFAVMATMLLHYELRAWPARDGLLRPAWLVIDHSWLGVEAFFVLSGFLITGILVDSKGSEHYWRNYYARRVLRVFPLYYAALVLVFFVLPWIGGASIGATNVSGGTQAWFWTYASNALVALHGWSAVPRMLSHFWTMAIEEQFYLVWPLVIFAVGRRSLLKVSVACAVGSLVIRSVLFATTHQYLYGWMLGVSRFDGLAIGAACALLWRDAGRDACRRLAARGGAALAVVMIAMSLWRHWANFEDPIVGTVGLTLWSALLGCVVLGLVSAAPDSRVARLFGARVLRSIGKYSYGIYVWHYIVLTALTARGFTIAALGERFGSTAAAHLVFVGINAALTYSVALVSWSLLERPFLALKRYFPYAAPATHADAPAPHPERASPWPGLLSAGEAL